MMVERCFEATEAPERFVGENAATVGGFGSYVGCGVDRPFSGTYVALEDMEASHGVSNQSRSGQSRDTRTIKDGTQE
jgi:hypothetical protein